MTTQQNPTLEGWQKELGRQWYKFFEKETQAWYNALLDHEPCMVCGIDPKLILGVSKLIPVEITAAKEEGRQEAEIKGVTMTDQVRADIVAAAERAAYERVIEEIPNFEGVLFVESVVNNEEWNEPIATEDVKQQLRAKFLNQGEEI